MSDIDLELYMRAFRNTENPAIITDVNYVVRDVNQACIDFTGYERDELVGKPPLMLFPDPDIYEVLIRKLENNQPWQGYFETETKEGHLIYGRGSAIPLIVDGEKRGYSGIFVDLTQRRHYEQALQVIHRVLRHDLRNEMNLVLGHLESLEPDLSEEHSQSIQKVTEVVERLLRRAKKARHLEALLHEGFEQPNRAIQLDSILEKSVARIGRRFPEADVVVGSIPRCKVIANELLGTVFESVLENAVIHNDGDPRIEVTVEDRDECVVVSIADNGPGVPDLQKDQIFGRAEEDDLHHGEGFSLYFVDSVVDLYRGSIDVTDNDWGGATFELRFQTP